MVESVAKRAGRGKGKAGMLALGLFFCVFLVMGSFFAWVFFLKPIVRIQQARGWPETTCTILSSQVEVHADSEGDTYSIEMDFRYEVDGIEYTADTYGFATGSSSGRARKQQVVDAHAPGTVTTCYFNPDHPQEAVIQRGMTGDIWFGAFTLFFPLVGLGGMVGTAIAGARRRRTGDHRTSRGSARLGRHGFSPSARPASAPSVEVPNYLPTFDANERPLILQPRGSRLGKLAFLLIFALFWNSLVGVFSVTDLIKNFGAGDLNVFLVIFFIPFIAIGLPMIGAVIYQLLKNFNPVPTLTLDEPATALGESLHLQRRVPGAARRIQTLAMTLIGQEAASYRVDTNTRTSRAAFFEAVLVETCDTNEMRSRSLTIAIPEDAMHSLSLESNSIDWLFRVSGEIPRWPDIKDEHAIVVLPKGGLA